MRNRTMEQVEIVQQLEKRDENQILSSMKGEVVKEWVYQIKGPTGMITQLSYAGVKEAIRRRGNIGWKPCPHCNQMVHIEENDKEIRATVYALDYQTNTAFLGAAEADKGRPFAFRLAVNKAERNALRKFLPEKAIALLIQEYLRGLDSKAPSVTPGKLA